MSVQGMACLKLFTNLACTRELTKNVEGNYEIRVGALSSNAYNPYTHTFFIKNDGSHTAYDCHVMVVSKSDDSMGITTEVVNNLTMPSGMIKSCAITFPVAKGEVSTKTILLNVSYDSI